jgi:hypothetical protein
MHFACLVGLFYSRIPLLITIVSFSFRESDIGVIISVHCYLFPDYMMTLQLQMLSRENDRNAQSSGLMKCMCPILKIFQSMENSL